MHVGLESGNDENPRAIRKTATVAEAREACRLIRQSGIFLLTFFIVGFPMDTEESLRDTMKFMEEVQSDSIVCSIFTPYPGTEMFELCRSKNLIPEDYDVSLYNHASPANCFCGNIPPERFGQLIAQAERAVDRHNRRRRLARMFSLGGLKHLRQIGIRKGLRRGLRLLLRKG